MKRIIIVAETMRIGGTEKALIGMLKCIDYTKYEVTLLLNSLDGELIDELPKEVKKIKYTPEDINLKYCLRTKSIIKIINYIYNGIRIRLTKNECKKYEYSCKLLPKISDEYDLAISYYMPRSRQVVYTVKNINAKYKYAWMHCDPLRMGEELEQYSHIYYKYDKIFAVSKEVADNLIKLFPNLNGKVDVFYNILEREKYKKLAQKEIVFDDDFDGKRILTVGRLSPEKQQDMIIPIIKNLLNDGYNVRWYCIGEGILREKLEREIRENNLENNLILLGSKKNPYPYFSKCDLYVQLSRHEGYCLTLAEARGFFKPIITTNFSGANEQIISGETGIIVENNPEDIYIHIKKILDNSELRSFLESNLIKQTSDSSNEINKLYWDLEENDD